MGRALMGIVASLAVSTSAVAARGPVRKHTVVRMEATAYCDGGETASGAQARRGIVAADPDVLPLGSRIRVDGLGPRLSRTYDVEDTGRLVKGREIDIFMADCQAAKEFGRQDVVVRVLHVGDNARTPGS